MESRRTLSSPVLVLNKAWVAIGTTSVRSAIVDISRGASRGVCTESFQMYDWDEWISDDNPPKVSGFIRAAGDKLVPAPDYVVLTKYDKLHKKTLYLGGKTLFIRDDYTCCYCKKRKKRSELSVDHIIPKSRPGGDTSWTNCITSCLPCNQYKANRTPREAGLPSPSPAPTKPKWSPVAHIAPHARLPTWDSVIH